MGRDNEIEIVDRNRGDISLIKGDRSIKVSNAMLQQIYTGMISLGIQFVSETGNVSVEYFKTQSDIYHGQLNAYIENQKIKSNERMDMLRVVEKLTEQYSLLINETDDVIRQEQLKNNYNFFVDKHIKLYTDTLSFGANQEVPKKPDLLSEIKSFFSRKKRE